MNTEADRIVLMHPEPEHAAAIAQLVRASPPLDANSDYAYLLLCSHFRQTCTVALADGAVVGAATGYRRPDAEATLFIWQLAVAAAWRGRGLGRCLVARMLGRCPWAAILETTVTASNNASLAVFQGLARRMDAPLERLPAYASALFGDPTHQEELLLRIGPFTLTPESFR